ncbi:aldo/keto reductase, partial [Paraburkholderia sp. BR14319]
LFQALLTMLRQIADRHGSDIATVASAAMLDRPGVAAVIIGARDRTHLASNVAISGLTLTAKDMDLITGVLAEATELEGDVYGLERDDQNGNRTRKP